MNGKKYHWALIVRDLAAKCIGSPARMERHGDLYLITAHTWYPCDLIRDVSQLKTAPRYFRVEAAGGSWKVTADLATWARLLAPAVRGTVGAGYGPGRVHKICVWGSPQELRRQVERRGGEVMGDIWTNGKESTAVVRAPRAALDQWFDDFSYPEPGSLLSVEPSTFEQSFPRTGS